MPSSSVSRILTSQGSSTPSSVSAVLTVSSSSAASSSSSSSSTSDSTVTRFLFSSILLTSLSFLVSRVLVILIGADDALHHHMTHHVLIVQLADADALHPFEYTHRLLQTAHLIRRQVDLRGVTGDDHLRAEAHARQEHLHLLAGGVLRLVEDDEAVVERAPAHIRQRRNLDVAALKILLIRLRAEHVEQRIIQRAQIRIDLALQVARQKAEPLARLDRGARENDAVDLAFAERRDCRGDGKIGLARAGRTDADGDGVFENGVH